MRRNDKAQSRDFALGVVDSCEYGVLSTVSKNGVPYGIPLTIARDGDSIYFHCARNGQKLDNLMDNNLISLACVGTTHFPKNQFTIEYESAIIQGKAFELTQDSEKIYGLRLLCEKYTPDCMGEFDQTIKKTLAVTGVWKIIIEQITGKAKKPFHCR